MQKPLAVLFMAIGLDAVGIGLVFPILPRLLAEVTRTANVAPAIGVMTALYAVMQFLFAPVLGALSDRWGRRPVLLLSLAGAALNYAVTAWAPQLWMLLLGRAVAGLTSANAAVANAYITDVSAEDQRARRFGALNATFALGFIVGPMLGGLLGDRWVRLPFLAAAALNAGNFLLAMIVLPESRSPAPTRMDRSALNPLGPLRRVLTLGCLRPVVFLFFLLSATGEAYGTCWAVWGADAFHWSGRWIGLSLGAFGVCQCAAQMLLPGPAVQRMGERRAILAGVAGTCAALIAMAFARQGWIVFAVMPVFALGGIGVPALQGLATRLVDGSQQGELQGVLASAVGFASIVGPLVFSTVYSVVQPAWPGAIWLAVVAVYGAAVPLVLGLRLPARRSPSSWRGPALLRRSASRPPAPASPCSPS